MCCPFKVSAANLPTRQASSWPYPRAAAGWRIQRLRCVCWRAAEVGSLRWWTDRRGLKVGVAPGTPAVRRHAPPSGPVAAQCQRLNANGSVPGTVSGRCRHAGRVVLSLAGVVSAGSVTAGVGRAAAPSESPGCTRRGR